MSFKTDRLAALLPAVYASGERASLIHRVLDALGAELMRGDAAVKDLLKSHWIDYATGGGLDGLGALLGVPRRLLPDGTPEGDGTFRPLLRSTVSSFVGGGTVEAVKGVVRAALGLPYDLELFQRQLTGPGGASSTLLQLVAGLRDLVRVVEFSPKTEVVLGAAAPTAAGSSTTLALSFAATEGVVPRVEWTFTRGGGRSLSLVREDTGAGVASRGDFEVREGETLLLAGGDAGAFSASMGTTDVTASFVDVDGASPPALPPIPAGPSRWICTALRAAEFDRSSYDRAETFDAAAFSVSVAWTRHQPLTFDVIVPYFVEAAIRRLLASTGFERRFTLFKGLSLTGMQRVVDESSAAGVRGMVQFSLSLPGESDERRPFEDHAARETLRGQIDDRRVETLDPTEESLLVGALGDARETHDAVERFALGGVFNVGVFDGSFGFQ